jgi:Zn-dependent protease with chaperone function
MIKTYENCLCSVITESTGKGLIVDTQTALTCPDCQSILPDIRRDSPWCECGWSSFIDEDLLQLKIPENYKRWIEKDRRHAQKLAEVDALILSKLGTRMGRFRWLSSLILSVILSAPFYLGPILLWIALFVGWGYTLWLGIPALIFIASLILACALLFHRLVKPDSNDPPSIPITAQQAPELFTVLIEVAERLQVPPVKEVQVLLHPVVGIEIHLHWKSGWRPVPTLWLGLLSIYALQKSQFKAFLAHEMAHLQVRDHLAALFLSRALRTLQELVGPQSVLQLLGVFGLPLWLIVRHYFYLVVRTSRIAMRRQEFMCDRAAALAYGRTNILEGLITSQAVQMNFNEFLPIMVQNIDNRLDSHDFFYQFTHHWEALTPKMREAIYARAMAQNRSVYDSHPSYKDRRCALEDVADLLGDEPEEGSALPLIPNATEFGRELTIQFYRSWNARRG